MHIFLYKVIYRDNILKRGVKKKKKYANMHTYFGEHILTFQRDASYFGDNDKKEKGCKCTPLKQIK